MISKQHAHVGVTYSTYIIPAFAAFFRSRSSLILIIINILLHKILLPLRDKLSVIHVIINYYQRCLDYAKIHLLFIKLLDLTRLSAAGIIIDETQRRLGGSSPMLALGWNYYAPSYGYLRNLKTVNS